MRKFNRAAYRRNVNAACQKIGNKAPKEFTTAIATNRDFVVYDAGMRIIGRLDQWEKFL